ncbi:type I-B CRISPR-associated protein Cas5b [Parabacteroides sp. Marseille-P3160]|uniref:type I-B CRISPR-associated protein Cas5b n=1 Tax=Parabacteroides sp. Marseille-P3160 TaxID=1917887 RepID=UPI0009BB7BA0|nr:type I-B CRISPR-associated protein Cas5b [Parabacteroides sp. Marseille-P3160]
MKLISFDLKADFAFFRKPDTNATINLSYNIIHRPAVLGILGAILGLEGYKEKGKLPQYYEVLKDVRIGIEPLNHEMGNYAKTTIKYSNTVGYANKGTNFLTEELTLVNPEYRIYLLLDEDDKYQKQLISSIQKGYAEFIPYLGKNEFTAWWNAESYKEYYFTEKPIEGERVKIKSIFYKKYILKNNTEAPFPDLLNFDDEETPFIYFERLPKGFDLALMQYDIAEFAYSNYLIKNAQQLDNLLFIDELNAYVQLL